MKPDDGLLSEIVLALNWARITLKGRDRSEREQRGYEVLCLVTAKAEMLLDDDEQRGSK